MVVRKIRPGEYKRCQQLFALAFEYEMKDAQLTPEALLKKVREDPRSMQDIHWDSQYAAFDGDDETMLATMTVVPWTARFDGHGVPMGGIGGVASLPQHRRGGAIRACFATALPDMYAGGTLLSYLYPFSTAFYRKFGYELGCDWIRCRLKLSGMPAPEIPGHWRLSEPDRPLTGDVRAIDRLREGRYNCMVLNGDTEYLYLRDNPFATRKYTYVYYDGADHPRAHMTVAPGNGELDCPRFVFSDREGFLGLLALLKRLSADHSHATVYLPDDTDLRGVLPEWSFGNVERTVQQRGMVRAVNVEGLLRLARARGEGRLRVAVEDDMQIDENNDCFEVDFAPERENRVRRVSDAPDIELTIQDFSRLIVGCCDLDPEWLPDVKLHCPVEQAAQVFYRKPTFISTFF
ncbi:MAG: GNAT family N-acetyltransferase [Clostridia bacterium]|nr:GNAT family N-acetyltransferase [Clostridia bacterium]